MVITNAGRLSASKGVAPSRELLIAYVGIPKTSPGEPVSIFASTMTACRRGHLFPERVFVSSAVMSAQRERSPPAPRFASYRSAGGSQLCRNCEHGRFRASGLNSVQTALTSRRGPVGEIAAVVPFREGQVEEVREPDAGTSPNRRLPVSYQRAAALSAKPRECREPR
jgi:hypothetical protein